MADTPTEHMLTTIPDPVREHLESALGASDLELPLLPDSTWSILQCTQRADADAAEITELLHRDQALAGNVLRVANSPLSGSVERIVSLQQAVSRLGMTKIREVSLCVSMQSEVLRCDAAEELIGDLRHHSFSAALFAKEIARQRRSNVEEAFLCGLLHDMGKPVLLKLLQDLEREIDVEFDLDLRRVVLNVFHDQVAQIMAERWKLADGIAVALGAHHDWPRAESFAGLAATVYFADRLAHELMQSEAVHPNETPLEDDPVLEELNLYPDQVEALRSHGETVRKYLEVL